jgi:hypothetical protein
MMAKSRRSMLRLQGAVAVRLLSALSIVLLMVTLNGAAKAESGAAADSASKGSQSSEQPGSTTTVTSGSGSETASPSGSSSTPAPVETPSVPADGTSPGQTLNPDAATLKLMPVPADKNAPKPPVGNGKPQIGVQMPPHKQLAFFLRINEQAARARIKIAEARCRQRLVLGGMDPAINIDDAMALGKPVINVYLKKSVGDNILAHGFCMQAYLCQYQRKPSGRVDLVRFARIGESPEVYSGADFEDKVVMLVDAYLSARHHQIKEAAAAAKKGKPGRGKKTK